MRLPLRPWSVPLTVACLAMACATPPRAPQPQPHTVTQPEPGHPRAKPDQVSDSPQPPAPQASDVPVAPSAATPAHAVPSQLRWRVEVSPAKLSMSGRARCRVRLLVTNEGAQSTTPQAHLGKFSVNGQPSMTADLAFSNGTMDQRWLSLAPKDTAVMERELCTELFPTPGKYTVGFQIGTEQVTAVANVSP